MRKAMLPDTSRGCRFGQQNGRPDRGCLDWDSQGCRTHCGFRPDIHETSARCTRSSIRHPPHPAEDPSAPIPLLISCLHHHPPRETAASRASPGRRRPCQRWRQPPSSYHRPRTTHSCREAPARYDAPQAAPSCILCDSSAVARAIVLCISCTGKLPRSYRALSPGHMVIWRSWKVPMATSSPHTGSMRACHDDPSDRPRDPRRSPAEPKGVFSGRNG